jgi:hypothetical protein
LEIGPWMMEVKATTSGDVRMTPTQAETASNERERYLLCVVDLRNTSDEERHGPWTAGTFLDAVGCCRCRGVVSGRLFGRQPHHRVR